MSYYNYGSFVLQNLTTLETTTMTSSSVTYNTTTIPWSTLCNITNSLSVNSANFSTIDSNNTTLNIGTVKATTINIGSTGSAIVNTKLTVEGSAVNAGTGIMCIKQKTGNYLNQTDGGFDPFSITSPTSGTNQYLTMGMGVDTTYNFAYINCAMNYATRPIAIGARDGSDIYLGYVPTSDLNRTLPNSTGNVYVKGNITSNGANINGQINLANLTRMKFGNDAQPDNGVIAANLYEVNKLHIIGINGNTTDSTNSNNRQTKVWGGLSIAGSLNADGTISAGSDIKIKKDIFTVDNALDKVLQLRGVYFTYIKTDTKSIGVIAQEVKEILPEVVTDVDGTLAVSYNSLSGVFIEAIKEMKTDYDKKITDLENRILMLEKLILSSGNT